MPERPSTIQENIVLAPYTTLKIGGPAKFFLAAKTVDEIIAAVAWARENNIAIRPFGAGANTLVSDNGFDGLIIILKNDQAEWTPPTVVIGAGATNGQLVSGAMQHGLGGLQWLIGVPGTVGGSIYGNAGGHGWGLGQQVDWVEILDEQGEVKKIPASECEFAYRHSILKTKPWIILRAQLHLPFADPAEERAVMAATTKMKNTNQPTTTQTAGCMFKNPTVGDTVLPDDLKQYINEDRTISAWRLIVAVGLQGFQLGQVQISPIHANFMTNRGGATADHVVQLLSLVKQKVRDTLGVQLQEEVQYLGF